MQSVFKSTYTVDLILTCQNPHTHSLQYSDKREESKALRGILSVYSNMSKYNVYLVHLDKAAIWN